LESGCSGVSDEEEVGLVGILPLVVVVVVVKADTREFA